MLNKAVSRELPIGVFDSGVGGLTVLQAIHRLLPHEKLLYLGDTARVPYGTKSAESVSRYAAQAAQVLIDQNIKALVVACNTASAVAVSDLQARYPHIPVIGVIEPGAIASCRVSKTGHIAVIATESTVRGEAYPLAIRKIRPDAVVEQAACSLFVALAEEGWVEGELLEQVLARYLQPLLSAHPESQTVDCLVLGCTHFPVLRHAIAAVAGPTVSLVDSAETTAEVLKARLDAVNLSAAEPVSAVEQVQFLVTDGPERFARVASVFFGDKIKSDCVRLVDLPVFA